MNKDDKKIVDIVIRYFILLVLGILGLNIFYMIFLPLTKLPVFWILSAFYPAIMNQNNIFIGSKVIEIVGACVAGSAYYFLMMLNLAIPDIKVKRRLYMIGLSFSIFLIINILRIILLSFMYIEESQVFDVTHKILWYLGSTLFVVVIWFFIVYRFDVKKIPFISDLKFIYEKSNIHKK